MRGVGGKSSMEKKDAIGRQEGEERKKVTVAVRQGGRWERQSGVGQVAPLIK